jgi:putative oxidoreductase
MGSQSAGWAPVPLRLIAGIGFIVHGYSKLFDMANHDSFVVTLTGMGIPSPNLTAWGVGAAEFVGGLAILLGAAVRVASVLLIVDMAVALFKLHLPHGFSFYNVTVDERGQQTIGTPGIEVPLVYIAILLSLTIMGPGRLALGQHPKRRSAPAAET